MRMGAGLGMEGDDIGTGLRETFQIGIDRCNHQVNVEDLPGVRAQGLHHHRADGDIGHEMPVHHIDMHPIGARRINRAHLFTQPRKVGGKNGGGNQRGIHRLRFR